MTVADAKFFVRMCRVSGLAQPEPATIAALLRENGCGDDVIALALAGVR